MSSTTVTAAAREAARVLVELFARDQQLAIALNAARSRLLAANDSLTAGLSTQALLAVYGPMGPDLGLSRHKPPVLADEHPIAALERVADEIRSAFSDYQYTADDRRVLAADIGHAAAELSAAMVAAGFTRADARNADIQALAAGAFRRHDSQ
ncbi:MAG: hypothetical protein QOC60_1577 [Frankiaceae bacterium]|nr:hypothetical protein [Frankiaceae bacterium]